MCHNKSILKGEKCQEPSSGKAQRVHISDNNDGVWSFLSKLRHPDRHINSGSASPVPTYLRRRSGIACPEALAALLVRQYEQEEAYYGRPMPAMVPSPVPPPRARRQFPTNMTGNQIRRAQSLSPDTFKQRFGRPAIRTPPTLPPSGKPKKTGIVVLEVAVRKAGAQRPFPGAPPCGMGKVVRPVKTELKVMLPTGPF